MKPVKFAYVGCGNLAQRVHIPNFIALDECDFRAIAEVRDDIRLSVAKHYGIARAYSHHLNIANDPEIEAVGVSGPYSLQSDIAEDLLKAGKHVLLEKPMAISIQQADRLVRASRDSEARLLIGYMKRYDAGNIRAKEIVSQWLENGEMGKLLYARSHGFLGNWLNASDPNIPRWKSKQTPPSFESAFPDWLPKEWRDSYLRYLQQWTHNINLLRYLIGDDDRSAKVRDVHFDADGATGVLVLDINGVRSVVESAKTNYHSWEEHTQLYFEKGWIKVASPTLMGKEQPAQLEIYRNANPEKNPSLTVEYAEASWSYREEARAFLRSLKTGEPFLASGEDSQADVRICEEVYQRFLAKF